MPAATYERPLVDTMPARIETDEQYDSIRARFGELPAKRLRGPAGEKPMNPLGVTVEFALSPVLWLSLMLLFCGVVAPISCFATISSLAQLVATDEMRGRAMSVYNVASGGGMPMGSFRRGGFVDRWGVQVVVAGMGGMPAAVGVYLFFIHRKVARL